MRNLPLLIIALALVAARPVSADSLFVGVLTNVNNATNLSAPVAVAVTKVPETTFYITHGSLTSTGALAVDMQFAYGDTNAFTTFATFTPSDTNAATETFTPTLYSAQVYVRARVRTTNSVDVAVTSR